MDNRIGITLPDGRMIALHEWVTRVFRVSVPGGGMATAACPTEGDDPDAALLLIGALVPGEPVKRQTELVLSAITEDGQHHPERWWYRANVRGLSEAYARFVRLEEHAGLKKTLQTLEEVRTQIHRRIESLDAGSLLGFAQAIESASLSFDVHTYEVNQSIIAKVSDELLKQFIEWQRGTMHAAGYTRRLIGGMEFPIWLPQRRQVAIEHRVVVGGKDLGRDVAPLEVEIYALERRSVT